MPGIDFVEFIISQLERLADSNPTAFVKVFDNEKRLLEQIDDLGVRVTRLFAVNEKLTISSDESTPEGLD